jgi:hypothetical protein
MSNPSPPDFPPSEPKPTRGHAVSSTARRSGAPDRYRTFRNLLQASENNRLASENNLRASENIVRATERGIQAADHTIEAAKEVIRVAEDAEWTKDDAGLDPRSPENLYTDDVGDPRSLDPEIVLDRWPEPRRARNRLRTFSILGLVLGVSAAAIVTYFMAAESPISWSPSKNERTADAIPADSQSAPEPAGTATNPPASPAATTSTPSDQTGASAAVRQLDRDEVAILVQHGEQSAMAGDLAAARLMLLRAAEAGDPRASLSLAATYDPIVLERLGVRGISADVAMARTWYEKAKEFGSAEAPRLLEGLAGRGQ